VTTVSLASAKGSPGVTTAALALTSWWARPAVLVEADRAGGDLAARLGLPEEPGLVGLAASLRRDRPGSGQVVEWLEPYVQSTSSGIRLVPGPAGSGQATTAIELLGRMSTVPAPDGIDLLVDLGRLVAAGHPGQPTPLPWFRHAADAFIWICRPHLPDLAHLAAQLELERDEGFEPSVVLAGAGPYPAAEVADTLGVTVLGHLPADPAGAAALWAGGGRTWAHSPLGRATKDLAAALAESIDTTNGSDAPAPSGADDGELAGEDRGDFVIPAGRDAVGTAATGLVR
jgi:hypothetical protein